MIKSALDSTNETFIHMAVNDKEPTLMELKRTEEMTVSEISDVYDNESDDSYFCDDSNLDSVNVYKMEIGRYPLLSAEEERELAYTIKNNLPGAKAARERLTNCNLRLVVSIAKRYSNNREDLLDMIQNGSTGLMKAVEKYDYTKGYKFSTYATWWIRQTIRRGIAEQSRTIRIPVHMTERINKIKKADRILTERLRRSPTIEEIASEVNLPLEKVIESLEWNNNPASLEKKVKEGENTTLGELLIDTNGLDPENSAFTKQLSSDVEKALCILSKREEKVIRLRFGIDDDCPRTLEEVGLIMGVTRERIRQIESKALRTLRRTNNRHFLEDYIA